jgi:tetratricopeptide (TPR) repeat protein
MTNMGYLKSQNDSAVYFTRLQYDFAKSKGLKKWMIKALETQGEAHVYLNNYDSAVFCNQQSLKIYEELGDEQGKSIAFMNIGSVYWLKGDWASSIDYYTRSLIIEEKNGNYEGVAVCLNILGSLYYEMKEYDKALEYLNNSLSLIKKSDDKITYSYILNNIGNIHKQGKLYKKALKAYKESLAIQEQLKNKEGIAASLHNIGVLYGAMGVEDKALNYLKRSLIITKELGFEKNIAHTLVSVGNIYHKSANNDTAIVYGLEALNLVRETSNILQISNAADLLYKSYESEGKKLKAFEMYKIYIQTRDSVLNKDNQKAILRQAFKYEFEKKALAKEIEHEKLRNADKLIQQKKTYFIVGGFLIFIFVLGTYLKLKQLRHLSEREKLLHEIELLKEKSFTKLVADPDLIDKKDIVLNKQQIEQVVNGKLNQTDWKVLNVIFIDPTITNKRIAEEISMSYEGTCSSLRKMYRLFNLKTSRNNKMTLILEATRISNELS